MSQGLVIGIDLGATNVRAAIGSLERGIISVIKERTASSGTSETLLNQLIEIIKRVASGNLSRIEAIGIGSIGPLDIKRGILLKAANARFRNVPIVERLSNEFKIPVYMLNDCTVAALGEKIFGAAKNLSNFVYVGIGTGIGGGVFVDGKLLLGKDGNAAEIGHMTIDLEDGLQCGCGGKGHWEAYCSGMGIPSFAKKFILSRGLKSSKSPLVECILRNELTPKKLFEYARRGDSLALRIVEEIGTINAICFANLINLFDPELITVGGSIALNNPDFILNPIKRNLKKYVVNRVPEIKITPLGDNIVLYGAIALAMTKIRLP
ncbi:MAG TPA: ROK family protein [Nitrososphaeria archaeon]|nr:ROK family protein [Nitrososphaeria archaeon]